MSRRRLLLISEHFRPSTGATAQLMSDLSTGLAERGWPVTVLTATAAAGADDGAAEGGHPAVRVVRLSGRQPRGDGTGVVGKAVGGLRFFISSLLWCLARGRRGDVVLIVSNPPFIGLLGPLIRSLRRLPYVFIFQDLFPRSAVLSGVLPAAGPVTGTWRLLMATVCRLSATTVVLNASMHERLQRDLGPRLPLTVIHNWAVERGLPTPRASNPFAASHGFQDRFTLQYSGNYGRLHDLLTLLEAARLLRDTTIQFVFIGGGAKQVQIDAYREAFDLQRVLRLPYQPRALLPQSLAACDLAAIGLVPGGEDTMAPCKVYGILASGRGIVLVARRQCDLAQLVLREECGVVVEPGESDELAERLLALSRDPEQVEAMGHRARALYDRRFGLERSLRDYAALLERVA